MQTGQMFPIERSNLFMIYELEKTEIEKLKWIESEKAGRDVGWPRAHWIWMTTHKSKWLAAMKASGSLQ